MILKSILFRQPLQVFQKGAFFRFFCSSNITDNNKQQKIEPSHVSKQHHLKSIDPKPEEGYAYGHYFPK